MTGPTASGKGAVGFELARLIGTEIVSVDSMKVYRGMDIGTGKPPPDVRKAIKHHMIDVADPSESFSLQRYLEGAERAIADIQSSGRVPLLVGGTQLYVRALLFGIFDGPPADWDLRHELMDRARTEGTAALHEELRRVDPRSADRIHPNDLKRIVRALEVHEKTGIAISQLQREYPAPSPRRACEVVVLQHERDTLKGRISERVDRMAKAGLVEEVRTLLRRPGGLGFTAKQALGYKEILDNFCGKCSLTEVLQSVKEGTWRLARKQLTWLRSLKRARWIEVSDGELPGRIAQRILRLTAEVSSSGEMR